MDAVSIDALRDELNEIISRRNLIQDEVASIVYSAAELRKKTAGTEAERQNLSEDNNEHLRDWNKGKREFYKASNEIQCFVCEEISPRINEIDGAIESLQEIPTHRRIAEQASVGAQVDDIL